MPNNGERHRLSEYALSVNELESRVGMDLFPALDDTIEEAVESSLPLRVLCI